MYNVEVGHNGIEEVLEVLVMDDEELLSLLNYIRSHDELDLVSVHNFQSIPGLDEFKKVLQEIEESPEQDED